MKAMKYFKTMHHACIGLQLMHTLFLESPYHSMCCVSVYDILYSYLYTMIGINIDGLMDVTLLMKHIVNGWQRRLVNAVLVVHFTVRGILQAAL